MSLHIIFAAGSWGFYARAKEATENDILTLKIWEWMWNLKGEYVIERRIILKTESWKEG